MIYLQSSDPQMQQYFSNLAGLTTVSSLVNGEPLLPVENLKKLKKGWGYKETIYIRGSSVTAGLAIVDAMNRNKCIISTVCTGIAANMGAFILSCRTKGMRYITPNATVMIHRPSGGASGQASDILITAERIKKAKEKINRILAQNTGQDIETITRDCDRDYYMDTKEALVYGIADKIL